MELRIFRLAALVPVVQSAVLNRPLFERVFAEGQPLV
jgi:hypothetical protein